MTKQHDRDLASRSRLKSCALLMLGPVVLLVALVVIFLLNNRPPNIAIPTHKLPKDNGWDYFRRAAKMMRGEGPVSSTRPQSSWTLPELKQFTEMNLPMLAEVREGLRRECMHPPVRTMEGYLFEDYAHSRELARKLLSMSRFYEKIGDYDEAARLHLDIVELGVIMPRGGPIVSSMVGGTVQMIGANGLGELLPKLSKTNLDGVAARVEAIRARSVSFAEVAHEEADASAAMDQWLLKQQDLKQLANPIDWFEEAPSLRHPLRVKGFWRGASYAFGNKGAFVRENRAYWEAVAKEQSGVYMRRPRVPYPRNVLAGGQLGRNPAADCRVYHEQGATVTTLLQAEVALRRFRFDRGRFPDQLTEVVPRYLKKVPIDPLGIGKPLRYKLLDGGKDFLLYSLGPNLKDDGGTSGSQSNAFRTGDIVAGKM